jgi:hypothetical protein
MPDPVTGVVGGASILGGVLGSQGQRDAANTQAASADRAAALQKQMYDEQVARNQPYTQAGLAAQNRLMTLMGLGNQSTGGGGAFGGVSGAVFNALQGMGGGDINSADFGKYARDFSMADFQQDPGYAFRLSEGQKALDRQAAARGGLMSGAALKAAARYGQDMGSQEYGNAFNRYQVNRTNQLNPLGNLMASGQSAANNQGTAAANYGTNAGNLMMQGGQAIAAGQLGQGNTFNNALNTMASSYQNQNNFNNWMNQNRQPSYGYVPSNANTLIPMQAGGGY